MSKRCKISDSEWVNSSDAFIEIGDSVWKKDKIVCCYPEKREQEKVVKGHDRDRVMTYNKWYLVCHGDKFTKYYEMITEEDCHKYYKKLKDILLS